MRTKFLLWSFSKYTVAAVEAISIFSVILLSIAPVISAEVVNELCTNYFDCPRIFAKQSNHLQKLQQLYNDKMENIVRQFTRYIVTQCFIYCASFVADNIVCLTATLTSPCCAIVTLV